MILYHDKHRVLNPLFFVKRFWKRVKVILPKILALVIAGGLISSLLCDDIENREPIYMEIVGVCKVTYRKGMASTWISTIFRILGAITILGFSLLSLSVLLSKSMEGSLKEYEFCLLIAVLVQSNSRETICLSSIYIPIKVEIVDLKLKSACCPECGNISTKLHETYWSGAKEISTDYTLLLQIRRYRFKCLSEVCSKKTFVAELPFIAKRARYTERAKDKVVSSITEDKMLMSRMRNRMFRDFHISPATSTIFTWISKAAKEVDIEEYSKWAVSSFSGVICIDEAYDSRGGKKEYLIIASDPIAKRKVTFSLTDSNGEDAIVEILERLEALGIEPDVIITDMWNAYSNAISKVFPNARHQLCVFHVIKDVLKHARKSMIAYRKSLTDKEEKRLIWEHRWNLLRAKENLFKVLEERAEIIDEILRKHKDTVLDLAYTLKEKVLSMFREGVTKEVVVEIRKEILEMEDMCEACCEHLGKIIKLFKDEERFKKMIVYLDYENLDRTNNRVERDIRTYRKREKTMYKSRKRETKEAYIKLNLEYNERRKKEETECKRLKLKEVEKELAAVA